MTDIKAMDDDRHILYWIKWEILAGEDDG